MSRLAETIEALHRIGAYNRRRGARGLILKPITMDLSTLPVYSGSQTSIVKELYIMSNTTSNMDASQDRSNAQGNSQSEPFSQGETKPTDHSGMQVTTQVPNPQAKPVDHKVISGSGSGDSRVSGDYAKASVDEIANAPLSSDDQSEVE